MYFIKLLSNSTRPMGKLALGLASSRRKPGTGIRGISISWWSWKSASAKCKQRGSSTKTMSEVQLSLDQQKIPLLYIKLSISSFGIILEIVIDLILDLREQREPVTKRDLNLAGQSAAKQRCRYLGNDSMSNWVSVKSLTQHTQEWTCYLFPNNGRCTLSTENVPNGDTSAVIWEMIACPIERV